LKWEQRTRKVVHEKSNMQINNATGNNAQRTQIIAATQEK
jgi:hypothetical protein